MKSADVVREAFRALRANPARTFLTALGITVGTTALTLILALSAGLETLIDSLVATDEQLRQVIVMPGFGRAETKGRNGGPAPTVEGEMSDLKRQRLQRTLLKRSRGGPPFQMRSRVIDAETERGLAAIPGVARSRAFLQERFEFEILGADGRPSPSADPARKPEGGLSLGVPADHPYYPKRLIAGRWFARDDEPGVVLHELLLFRMGFTSDESQAALVGRTVRLTARKGGGGTLAGMFLGMGGNSGGAVAWTEDVPVLGVIRERFGLEPAAVIEEAWAMQTDVFVGLGTARTWWDRQEGRGGPQAVLLVAASLDDVPRIEEQVAAMGLEVRTVQEAVTAMKSALSVMTAVASVLAGIALFVSALGIVNTLVMSVVERTREIGLLKALGASDGDVARLFVAEAAILGVCGGVLGAATGWVCSAIGDEIGRKKIEEVFLMPFQGDVFVYSPWLGLGGVAFAVGVAVLASIVPTLRASRIDPVRALRHE